MNNVLTESVIKPEEPAKLEKTEQLKPSDYFPGQELELLKARMKREVKAFSHNELARQYVDLYTTLIVLNKDYMALQKVLKDVKQLEGLLEEAVKLKAEQEKSAENNSEQEKSAENNSEQGSQNA